MIHGKYGPYRIFGKRGTVHYLGFGSQQGRSTVCTRRGQGVLAFPPRTDSPAVGMYGEAGGLKTIGHVDAANIDVGRDARGQAWLPITARCA